MVEILAASAALNVLLLYWLYRNEARTKKVIIMFLSYIKQMEGEIEKATKQSGGETHGRVQQAENIH